MFTGVEVSECCKTNSIEKLSKSNLNKSIYTGMQACNVTESDPM